MISKCYGTLYCPNTKKCSFNEKDRNQADFYLLSNCKLYPLQKEFISISPYFSKAILSNHRVHVLNHPIDSRALEKVLSSFYGIAEKFHRAQEAEPIMLIIEILKLQNWMDAMRKDMLENFEEYEIFFLLRCAYKFEDLELENRCHSELIKEGFEQFNFNKMELLKCETGVFIKIVKLHQKLKNTGKIKGLKFEEMIKIIKLYNLVNTEDIDPLLVLGSINVIREDSEEEKEENENNSKILKSLKMSPNEELVYDLCFKIFVSHPLPRQSKESLEINNFETSTESTENRLGIVLTNNTKSEEKEKESDDMYEASTSPKSDGITDEDGLSVFWQKNNFENLPIIDKHEILKQRKVRKESVFEGKQRNKVEANEEEPRLIKSQDLDSKFKFIPKLELTEDFV